MGKCLFALLATIVIVNGQSFKYDQQNLWDPQNCGSQKTRQSPINLVSTKKESIKNNNLHLSYNGTNAQHIQLNIVNKGYTIVTENNDKYLDLFTTDINGKSYNYQILQFHLHAPSEHQINGKSYDLEIHFVFTLLPVDSGKTQDILAVLGVMFQVDDTKGENPFLKSIQASYDANTQNQAIPTTDIDATFFKDLVKTPYYKYQGSLTTPPCHEHVNWHVLTTPQTMTTSQLNFYKSKWAGNATFANGAGNNRNIINAGNRGVTLVEGFGSRTFALISATISMVIFAFF